MKKCFAVFLLLCISFFNTQAKNIVNVDSVSQGNGISIYLNNSDGSTDEIGLQAISCYPVACEGIFVYDICFKSVADNINVNFSMFNFFNENKSVCCIVAVYRNNILFKTEFEQTEVGANHTNEISIPVSDFNRETDTIRTYVWDSLGGLRPLGDVETISENENVISRQYAYVNCNEGDSFKLYITSPLTVENIDLNYNIEYNSDRINPENLCVLKYPAVLSEGYIPGAGIEITEFLPEDGNIKYTSSVQSGFSGINNIILFTAKEQLVNEEIELIVTKY